MTTGLPINSMLHDLWRELQEPAVLWQVGTVALCLLLAWLAERRVLGWYVRTRKGATAEAEGRQGGVAEAGGRAREEALRALRRILFPLFGLGLLLVARPVLGLWHNTKLVKLAIVLLVAAVAIRLVVRGLSHLPQTRGLVALERVVGTTVWVIVALYLTGLDADLVAFLESMTFPVGKHRMSVWDLLNGGFWVLLTMLATVWAGGALETRLLALDTGDVAVRAVLARVLRAVLILVGLLVGMSVVGLDITALSVFSGALGVGIGLGLQRIASSYVSGFVVLLERRVRIGDTILVDKYRGQVTEIRTRFMVLKSGEGWEAIVPNELLMTGTVQNFSQQPHQRIRTTLSVAGDSDVDRTLQSLLEAARSHPRVLADPAPLAQLTGFGPDGLGFELAYSVDGGPGGAGTVPGEVNRAVWASLRAHGIALPIPQREIRVSAQGETGVKSPF